MLKQTVLKKGLQSFYPNDSSRVKEAAALAVTQIDDVCEDNGVEKQLGQDLVKLALFDGVLCIDNSSSMRCEEYPLHINQLQEKASHIIKLVGRLDTDGFDIRFINGSISRDNVQGACLRLFKPCM